jgi:1-deoxy-D-xylulose-5-phosphate synthase
VSTPVRDIGVALDFHPHGSRAELLAELGLTPQDVAREVTGWLSGLDEFADPGPRVERGEVAPDDIKKSAGPRAS